MIAPCKLIQEQIGELFRCAEVGKYVRIRTPFLYPDGDYIDLFLQPSDGVMTLTDLGETVRWLRMQTVSPRRSRNQTKMIQDICLNHGIEFYKGMLLVRFQLGENLAMATTRLAQAALRVADIWFTFRSRAVESVAEEVADLLTERKIDFEPNANLLGRSGRSWSIHFQTRTPKRSSLVSLLSTGSRGAVHRITEHVVAAWYDLNHLKVGPEAIRFVSLFDDTVDVWSDEDFRQLEELSDIARWSEPEGFVQLLQAA